MNIKCPACGVEFSDKPLKIWRFRFYDASRYECPRCRTRLNVYDNPRSRFVIFRKRSKNRNKKYF